MAKCVLNAARHFLVPPEAALASVGTFHFFVAVAAVRFILCALFVPLFFLVRFQDRNSSSQRRV